MKKYINYTLLLSTLLFICSCSSDDDPIPTPEPQTNPTIEVTMGSSFAVDRYNVIKIEPTINIANAEGVPVSYQWSINENGTDSIIGKEKTLAFISPRNGAYTVDFTVTCGNITQKKATQVTVKTNGKTFTKQAGKVIDYLPAPFDLYWLFQYIGGESRETLLNVAQTNLDSGSEAIELGTFGGYVVLQFDHTVINTYGKRDFFVNCNNTNKSPAIIQVAYDANKNGIADEDEWYEIAGSEHHKSTTIKDYEITYYEPDYSKDPVPGKLAWQVNTELLKWSDNKGGVGYITQTDRTSSDSYYPAWAGKSFSFTGTKLYLPTKDVSDGEGTKWNVGTYDWGYGGAKDSTIDIDWAVNKDGDKVNLPGIDFVRLYTSSFNEIGPEGLLTAKILSVEDLNFVASDKS